MVSIVEARLDVAEASGVQRRPQPLASGHRVAPPPFPVVFAKLEIQSDVLHEQALGVLAATDQEDSTVDTMGGRERRGRRGGVFTHVRTYLLNLVSQEPTKEKRGTKN